MSGEAYTHLLNGLDEEKCDLSGLKDKRETRFEKIINNAEGIGAVPFICHHDDISCGNPKLNLLFTASIYHAHES